MIVKAEKAWHCADTVETMIVKAEKAWHSAGTGGDFPKFKPKGFAWQDRKKDGKTPIRNHCRLLCRQCDSDIHLIRDCDKLSRAQKTFWAEHRFSGNTFLEWSYV